MGALRWAAAVCVAFAVCLPAGRGGEAEDAGPEKVSFKTSDGVTVYGTYYAGPSAKAPVVVCCPALRKTREVYNEFAPRLQKAGYAVLAIDMRGHGESVSKEGERLDVEKFKAADFKDMKLDVEAAFEYLEKEKKLDPRGRAILGASIGSTAALLEAAEDPKVKALVMLSPGLKYREVDIMDAYKKYLPRPVLVVAAEGDIYSLRTAKALNTLGGKSATLETRKGRAHGTGLFMYWKIPEAVEGWLKKTVPPGSG